MSVFATDAGEGKRARAVAATHQGGREARPLPRPSKPLKYAVIAGHILAAFQDRPALSAARMMVPLPPNGSTTKAVLISSSHSSTSTGFWATCFLSRGEGENVTPA